MNFTLFFEGKTFEINLSEYQNLNDLFSIIQKKVCQVVSKGAVRVDRQDGEILDQALFLELQETRARNTNIFLIEPQILIQINSSIIQIPILDESKPEVQHRLIVEEMKKEEAKRESIFLLPQKEDDLFDDIESLKGISESFHIEQRDSMIQSIFRKSCLQPLKIQEKVQRKVQKDRDYNMKKKENERKEEEKEEEIMSNVQCDRCFTFPIKGPIFRCLVCASFDLCSRCQEKYHHFHPLLEITTAEHWPTNIKVSFKEDSLKYMQAELKREEEQIKKQKREKYSKKDKKWEEVDASTLKSKEIKGPNFVAQVLNLVN